MKKHVCRVYGLLKHGSILFAVLSIASILPGCGPDDRGTLSPGVPWIEYHSPDLKRVAEIGIDRCIDLDTGTLYNDFSRVWIGLIEWPADAAVSFYAEADDGLRLFLDRNKVIDGWSKDGRREGSWRAGKGDLVPFRLEHFQNGGTAHMRLYWSWEGHVRELIPAAYYYYSPAQEDTIEKWAEPIRADLSSGMRPDHSAIYQSGTNAGQVLPAAGQPIPAFPGPHVLVSDQLLAHAEHVSRRVCQPEREPDIPNPLVNSRQDRCFQPFFSVLPDPESGVFRIWYGAWRDDTSHSRSHLAFMTSPDGIHFDRPVHLCSTPEIQFGSEVIDRGPEWVDPARRYVYIYWLKGGSRLLTSPDGLNWNPVSDTTIILHNHDITGLWWDPVRRHYVATLSTMMRSDRWSGRRRTTMHAYSKDLVNWTDPAYVLYANPAQGDAGETQFYGMSGYLVRGPLVIAMVKVLRDDIISEGVAPDAFGRSYTTLAWSYDGVHWVRDLSPFFEPDPDPSAWDHAHAWIDEQLLIGDSTWLYYGGYRQGHKKNRFSERQIGLVRMPRDRYVAWENSPGRTGVIGTVPILLNEIPRTLQLNADARNGWIRVAIRDAETGRIIAGLDSAACMPATGDDPGITISWNSEEISQRLLQSLAGRTVSVIFWLENARLFSFEFK